MVRKAALALLFVPAIAHGQTTNTTCFRNGQIVNCTSNTTPAPQPIPDYLRQMGPAPDPYGSFLEGMERNQALQAQQLMLEERRRQAQAAAQRENQQALEERNAEQARGTVSRMLAHGYCAEAVSYALERGQVQLAAEAKAFCAADAIAKQK